MRGHLFEKLVNERSWPSLPEKIRCCYFSAKTAWRRIAVRLMSTSSLFPTVSDHVRLWGGGLKRLRENSEDSSRFCREEIPEPKKNCDLSTVITLCCCLVRKSVTISPHFPISQFSPHGSNALGNREKRTGMAGFALSAKCRESSSDAARGVDRRVDELTHELIEVFQGFLNC